MGFFEKLKQGLSKTASSISSVFTASELDDEFYDDLEESLIVSDLGMDTTEAVMDRLRQTAKEQRIKTVDEAKVALRGILADMLNVGDPALKLDTKPSVILVIGVNGVGKTTTSANVGTGLAMLGKRVVLIDTDIGLRNLDVVMGLENRIIYNLVDVIEGNCRMKQALIRDKRYPDLFLLPSAQTRDKSSVSPGQMIKLVEDLREEFDYILLDCPAGIEQGFRNAIAGADRALIVTTPEVSAIRDADRIIGLLEASGVGRMDLIINRIRSDMVRRGDMMSVDDVMDILSVPVIGTVPDDEDIVISTNQGEPLVGMNGYAGQAYLNICKRILGESVPFIQLDASPGFWSRISGFLKRA